MHRDRRSIVLFLRIAFFDLSKNRLIDWKHHVKKSCLPILGYLLLRIFQSVVSSAMRIYTVYVCGILAATLLSAVSRLDVCSLFSVQVDHLLYMLLCV